MRVKPEIQANLNREAQICGMKVCQEVSRLGMVERFTFHQDSSTKRTINLATKIGDLIGMKEMNNLGLTNLATETVGTARMISVIRVIRGNLATAVKTTEREQITE